MAANPIDCSQDLTQIGNVLVLEVDNILRGWPTYVVNVIPDHPGPLVRGLSIFQTHTLIFSVTEACTTPQGTLSIQMERRRRQSGLGQ